MSEQRTKRTKAAQGKDKQGSLQRLVSTVPLLDGVAERLVMPNRLVCSMLTDFYQLTMAYAYWRSGKHLEHAVFDLFFRKNPFKGEFTIFAGLEDCVRHLTNFGFSDGDIDYLKTRFPPDTEEEFFVFLRSLSAKDITLHAIPEGSVVFPRVPMLRVEGPLAAVQLLETTFLTLVNFASLVTTNAARYRVAAGANKIMLEFGLRRAQGPDGGMTASKYTYLGGCDGTSNVLAGKMYGIPISGTHAHAFVCSYESFREIKKKALKSPDGKNDCSDFTAEVKDLAGKVRAFFKGSDPHQGELASFTAYALAFPTEFTALIDTYDTLRSGCVNFITVALALHKLGYTARGIRLDSGDLAYLSNECRAMFGRAAENFNAEFLKSCKIVASNDINEETLYSLNSQGHSIDVFGIGTHLVTCQSQPALGAVYKLVELEGVPRMKLSADFQKVSIPTRKIAYRIFGTDGKAILDLLQSHDEPAPKAGEKVMCRHPFEESKRANVIPKAVEQLHVCVWKDGKVQMELPTLQQLRERVQTELRRIRGDHMRSLNPTPYKVSVSPNLYKYFHGLWSQNLPVGELS
eukprot:m.7309 g.7309  ORF g.7309 m.7309 type:complete len:575 (+) comp4671_c0_seq1:94-1818(+)